jgi:VanZ family protein
VRRAGRAAWWLFAVAVIANLLLLYWPRAPGTGGVPHLDKAVHFVSFAFVTWTGVRAGIAIRSLVAVLSVHAIASELIQGALLPGRSGDAADVLADLAGVACVGLAAGAASWRHGRGPAQDRRRASPGRAAPRREPGAG